MVKSSVLINAALCFGIISCSTSYATTQPLCYVDFEADAMNQSAVIPRNLSMVVWPFQNLSTGYNATCGSKLTTEKGAAQCKLAVTGKNAKVYFYPVGLSISNSEVTFTINCPSNSTESPSIKVYTDPKYADQKLHYLCSNGVTGPMCGGTTDLGSSLTSFL